jgi:hypothetical protein
VFKRWSGTDDRHLRERHESGYTVEEIAVMFNRTAKAIENRLYHLGLTPNWKARP